MKKLSIYILSFLLIIFVFHTVAFARAGGGEAFGGGDFSGGGIGGGGFSSGGFFFLPFFFGGGNFSWLAFLILFFFIIPFFLRRFGPNNIGGGYARRTIANPMYIFKNIYEANLIPITQDDPEFNKDRFIDKVQTAFFAIQKAWMEKDLTQVRGFVTDAQYQRLKMQVDDYIQRGVTNVLENIAIGGVKISKITKDEHFETIECAILASMKDYDINDNTKKVVRGNPNDDNPFIEYWTFMRSANAKTKENDSIITKTCPNCGAPMDINEFGKCKYCQAYIVSGDFDWVLSDISQ